MRFAAFGAVISQKVCLLLHLFVLGQLTFRQFLNLALFTPSVMSHGQFIVAYETVPLGFLISTPKALRILLVHKIREPRFQLLLFNWAFALLALLGAGICGFSFMPTFLAIGVVAEGVLLFFLVLFIDAGDVLLDFALEDEQFFELAIRCHALGVFGETEFAPPQSVN
jgi:hypothetical protein